MSSQVRRLLFMPVLVKSDAYVLLCAALEKCTCGAISAKKLGTTPQPLLPPPPRSLPPPLPSSSTSVPPSPAAAAPTPSIVDGRDRAAAPTTPVVVETTANKPRELRRGREGETVCGEGESAPKRRKITPSPPPRSAPVSAPSLTPPSTAAPPTPVSDVVQVAATHAEETVVVVPADKDRVSAAVSAPNHHPHQSAPGPESLPEPDPKPKPTQEQGPDPSAAAATDNDDVVSAPRKIGIQHIQLAYETVGETLQCRMCLYDALPLVHIY